MDGNCCGVEVKKGGAEMVAPWKDFRTPTFIVKHRITTMKITKFLIQLVHNT